ncbi:hypothetical protein MLD38_029582 [Melastoma candidum]|uniref:Uncharacterized protein n=1 Tax=Melastoma candidum TaxID=119954 RepID=A0ACB9N463_9MYRT|nr:hypothetical protein MLD38_029582 [Melastoma candidum]
MMAEEDGRTVVIGGAMIDTRPPFKSVKEAVMLFGERVLAGEVVAPRLKQVMRDEKVNGGRNGPVESWKAAPSTSTVLEETRWSLSDAREENNRLANRVRNLKQELDRATREIEWLKLEQVKGEVGEKADLVNNTEFIENIRQPSTEGEVGIVRFGGRQKSVKFASPPLLTRVITGKEAETAESLSRPGSTNGTKKGVVSAIVRLFSKRMTTRTRN